jgi:RNA polymerase-associated protein CTR9
MYIRRGDMNEALDTFTKIHKQYPNDFDTLRILGSLCGMSTDRKKQAEARTILQKAVAQDKNNVILLVELAQVCECDAPEDAYKAYKRVVVILDKVGVPVPPPIRNNLGVLCHKLGKLDEAAQCYQQAAGTWEEGKIPADKLTIYYNMGLLHEATADEDKAIKIYDEISALFPGYVDSLLRKGRMQQQKGREKEAIEIYKEALTHAVTTDHKLTIHSMLGNLHLKAGRWNESMAAFKHVLKGRHKEDPYALLALGNIAYARAIEHKTKQTKGEPPKGVSVTEASKQYLTVLKKDPTNKYAVNGLGACMGAWKFLHESKDLFLAAKGVSASSPTFAINLGHCYLAMGQHQPALAMYSSAQGHPDVPLFIARTYYVAGQMMQAKNQLVKACAAQPENWQLWYNLALTMEEYAITILQKYNDERNFEEVPRACAELAHAARIFQWLSKRASSTTVREKSSKHGAFCQSSREVAGPHLERALKKQADSKAVREESERKRAEVVKRMQEEEAAVKKAKEDEVKRLEDMAAAKKIELAKIKSDWANAVEAEKKEDEEEAGQDKSPDGKKKKKRKRKAEGDDDDDGLGLVEPGLGLVEPGLGLPGMDDPDEDKEDEDGDGDGEDFSTMMQRRNEEKLAAVNADEQEESAEKKKKKKRKKKKKMRDHANSEEEEEELALVDEDEDLPVAEEKEAGETQSAETQDMVSKDDAGEGEEAQQNDVMAEEDEDAAPKKKKRKKVVADEEEEEEGLEE